MTEPRTHVPVPDWQLERYLLRELPLKEMERLQRFAEQDPALRDRLDALERENAAMLERHPPRLAAAAILAKLDASSPKRALSARRRLPRHAWAAALAVLATAIGVSLLTPLLKIGRAPSESENRIKGLLPQLLLYRQTQHGAEALASGSTARENDVIQLAYQAAGRRYGVIVSIDGRGVVTQHLPKHGKRSAQLTKGGPVALAEAYRLDDAPRFERFVLVAADEPFAVDLIVAAARQTLTDNAPAKPFRLPLPDSFDQFAFMLNKESIR